MNKLALDLGFIKIYWYSLFIFLAMLTACFFVFKEAKKQKIDTEFLANLTFNTIIIAIIGARLYFVLFNLDYYLANPIEIFEVWNGGLAIHGGLLAALVYIMYTCKKNNIDVIKITDIVVVGLLIGQAIGRWGNFFNSEAFGPVTTYGFLKSMFIPEFIIRGMKILGQYRQPTFLYESLWCCLGFVIILVIRKICHNLRKGQLTGFYLVWYGTERLIVESLRTDSLMIGPYKIAQVVSIVFIIVGVYLLTRYCKKEYRCEKYLYSYEAPNQQD